MTSNSHARANRQWTAAILAAGLLGCAACGGKENPVPSPAAGAAPPPGAAAKGATPAGPGPGARTAAPGSPAPLPGIPPPPVAVTATQVVARVNGEPIDGRHLIDLWTMQRAQLMASGRRVEPAQEVPLEQIVLDLLVDQVLLHQAAVKSGIKAEPKEIDDQIARMRKAYPNEQRFQEALKISNLTMEGARAEAARRIVIDKYYEIVSQHTDVRISDDVVRSYYDANIQDFTHPERVHARMILRSLPAGVSPAEKAEARKKIDEALAKVKGGADFAGVAREYSTDVTSTKGGDLGFFPRGKLYPQIEDAAFKLKPGDVTDVIETPKGFHVLKIEEHESAGPIPFDKLKPELKKILEEQGRQKVREEVVKKLHDSAKIDILVKFPEAGSGAEGAPAPAAPPAGSTPAAPPSAAPPR